LVAATSPDERFGKEAMADAATPDDPNATTPIVGPPFVWSRRVATEVVATIDRR
jgi:hypothetical protein